MSLCNQALGRGNAQVAAAGQRTIGFYAGAQQAAQGAADAACSDAGVAQRSDGAAVVQGPAHVKVLVAACIQAAGVEQIAAGLQTQFGA